MKYSADAYLPFLSVRNATCLDIVTATPPTIIATFSIVAHDGQRVIHDARSGICSPRMSGIVEYAASTNT